MFAFLTGRKHTNIIRQKGNVGKPAMGPVGLLVKKHREALGLNKTAAARACGLRLPGYSRIEGGHRYQLWGETVSKLVTGLKIPPQELIDAMDTAREQASKQEPALA